MPLTENQSLQSRHTFHLNVRSRYWADYESVEELRNLLNEFQLRNVPVMAIGGGSNILFTSDYQGILMHSALKSIDSSLQNDGSVLVRAGSGIVWDDLVEYCVQNGWSGLENLSGIPGEVGASPVQNIGAYGSEAGDCIESVRILRTDTLEFETLSNQDCNFGYRDSIFKHELKNRSIVCYVTYRLSATFTPNLSYGDLRAKLEEKGEITLSNLRCTILEIRNSKLPDCSKLGNAGSFFMNPEISQEHYIRLVSLWPGMPGYPQLNGKIKISAAWCIDKAGWKGKSLGNAAVHNQQALVLVNKGNATADEILLLCNHITLDVENMFGVKLRPEVIFV
jgi:UDP-N-acetylmuramate dehydrogenase